MNKHRERVTFLVGAGIVADAKLPMSVGLVEKLKTALIDACDDTKLDEKERHLAKLQLAVLRFLIGGIRFQQGILNSDPDRDVNIEQVCVAALELQDRLKNPLAPYAFGWHPRIVELETQQPGLLASFIEFIYSRLNIWLTHERITDIAYLARLADFCSDGIGIDIFSLNHDLCIETALRELAKKSFINGFTKDGWRSETFHKNSPIRLFKLHGSLDWADDELYGVCSFKFPRHNYAEDIEGQHRPLLIFGTSHKLSAREPFLSLAYHFAQCILKTKVLVIIGYSFGDAYIEEIIEQGLRGNTQLKIIVVSPDAEKQVNDHRLLKNNPRVFSISKGAKEVLNDGSLLTKVRQLLEESLIEAPF
jgi:hypothetical protein